MHGHAKIELTDVKTGQTTVIENDNMVTNALNDLFGCNFLNQNVYPLPTTDGNRNYPLDQYFPVISNAIGGIYLFNKPNEENKDSYFAPIDNKLIGCGSNDTNTTNLIKNRGHFNATASKFSNNKKSYTFVWDFNQEQANGEISSISLTSALGGKQYFTDCEYTPFYYSKSDYNLFYNFCKLFGSYSYPYDIDFEKGILYTADLAKKSDGKIIFRKYIIPTSGPVSLHTVNSFQEETTYQKEVTIGDIAKSAFKDGTISIYSLHGYIYLFISSTAYGYTSPSKKYLIKLAADTFEIVEEKEILTDSNLCMLLAYHNYSDHNCCNNLTYHNKFLLPYTNNQTSGTCLFDPISETVEDLGLIGAPCFLINDTLITRTSIYDLKNRAIVSSNCFTLFQGANGWTFGYTYNGSGYQYQVIFSRVYKNYIMAFITSNDSKYLITSVLPQYLVTINNLSEPITKTSDQTMRITYTLTEAED